MDKWMTRYQFLAKMLLLLLYVLVWSGCAHYLPLPDESRLHVYVAEASDPSLTGLWAPAFLAYEYAEAYNRIGRPVVEKETGRSENIVVDVRQPAVYTMTRTFMTEKGQYTNLIYRVHLETLFLSVISLDLFVGTDKIYADPEVWGNRFYTSLKPWRREDSDMWDFARFLQYWGWRL